MTTEERLERGLGRVQRDWITGGYRKNLGPGRTGYCTVGAVDQDWNCIRILALARGTIAFPKARLIMWNDRDARQVTVIALFQRAIALAAAGNFCGIEAIDQLDLRPTQAPVPDIFPSAWVTERPLQPVA